MILLLGTNAYDHLRNSSSNPVGTGIIKLGPIMIDWFLGVVQLLVKCQSQPVFARMSGIVAKVIRTYAMPVQNLVVPQSVLVPDLIVVFPQYPDRPHQHQERRFLWPRSQMRILSTGPGNQVAQLVQSWFILWHVWASQYLLGTTVKIDVGSP